MTDRYLEAFLSTFSVKSAEMLRALSILSTARVSRRL